MDVTEGPTKPTKLQIAVTPVLFALQHPHKPCSVLGAPAFISDCEGKAVWFSDATAKHTDWKSKYRAVAFHIETGVEVVEEEMGNAQVGELKAVFVKE